MFVPVVVFLAAAMVLPAAAGASTTVSLTGKTIRATSDPGEKNKITLELDLGIGAFTVDDPLGVVATSPCTQVSLTEAACAITAHRIIVNTGDGKDQIGEGIQLVLFSRLISDPANPFIFNGGPGNDTVTGGMGGEKLIGGPGNDVIVGFDGNDILDGGPGADRLDAFKGALNLGRDHYFGGPGPDRINARDFTKDLSIDCGSGHDKLTRDRFDPRPKRCP